MLMNPAGMGRVRPCGRFFRPADGLQRMSNARFRADQLIEDYAAKKGLDINTLRQCSPRTWNAFIAEKEINCPACRQRRNFTGIRKFNLMFKTFQGVTEDSARTRFFCVPKRRRVFSSTSRTYSAPRVSACRSASADRQVVPQRDHAGQLHLPHPRVRADGAGVLLCARRGDEVV